MVGVVVASYDGNGVGDQASGTVVVGDALVGRKWMGWGLYLPGMDPCGVVHAVVGTKHLPREITCYVAFC